jgi:hypothetical protein
MGSSFYQRLAQLQPGESVGQAYQRIAEECAYESGHSYSGDFGSKMNGVVVYRVPATCQQLTALKRSGVLECLAYEISDAGRAALDACGIKPVQFATFAQILDDKWGPALALRCEDGTVLFAGECSS